MKRNDIKTVRNVTQKFNPFYIRDGYGNLIFYENTIEAYKECLTIICREFPAGFIDIGLFMRKYQQLASIRVNTLLGEQQYAFCKIWDTHDVMRTKTLRAVVHILLKVSGSNFDEVTFSVALDEVNKTLREFEDESYLFLNNVKII